MKQLLLVLIVIVLGLVGAIVLDKIIYVYESSVLQASFEREIQKLAESGKDYVVGYDDDAISGIFVFKNTDDLNLWVAQFK